MIITAIIESIIKQQNRELLKKIANKYELDITELESKYLTPSYYSIDINKDKIYKIIFLKKFLLIVMIIKKFHLLFIIKEEQN
jgi:hypothetical protein